LIVTPLLSALMELRFTIEGRDAENAFSGDFDHLQHHWPRTICQLKCG
jgi:hypothetical protein